MRLSLASPPRLMPSRRTAGFLGLSALLHLLLASLVWERQLPAPQFGRLMARLQPAVVESAADLPELPLPPLPNDLQDAALPAVDHGQPADLPAAPSAVTGKAHAEPARPRLSRPAPRGAPPETPPATEAPAQTVAPPAETMVAAAAAPSVLPSMEGEEPPEPGMDGDDGDDSDGLPASASMPPLQIELPPRLMLAYEVYRGSRQLPAHQRLRWESDGIRYSVQLQSYPIRRRPPRHPPPGGGPGMPQVAAERPGFGPPPPGGGRAGEPPEPPRPDQLRGSPPPRPNDPRAELPGPGQRGRPAPPPQMTQSSAGYIGQSGLVPERFQQRRGQRPPQVADFDRRGGVARIREDRGAEAYPLKELPVPADVQDRLSWLYQLPAWVAAVPTPKAGDVFHVASLGVQGLRGLRFVLAGAEDMQTPAGVYRTWHLVRVAPPNQPYARRLDVWVNRDSPKVVVRLTITSSQASPIDMRLAGVGEP